MKVLIFVIFSILASNALASEFLWKVVLLDKVSREEKTFVLSEDELKLKVPGKAKCMVQKLDAHTEGDSFRYEYRSVTCTLGTFKSYTFNACAVSRGGATITPKAVLGIYNGKEEFTLTLICEK